MINGKIMAMIVLGIAVLVFLISLVTHYGSFAVSCSIVLAVAAVMWYAAAWIYQKRMTFVLSVSFISWPSYGRITYFDSQEGTIESEKVQRSNFFFDPNFRVPLRGLLYQMPKESSLHVGFGPGSSLPQFRDYFILGPPPPNADSFRSILAFRLNKSNQLVIEFFEENLARAFHKDNPNDLKGSNPFIIIREGVYTLAIRSDPENDASEIWTMNIKVMKGNLESVLATLPCKTN